MGNKKINKNKNNNNKKKVLKRFKELNRKLYIFWIPHQNLRKIIVIFLQKRVLLSKATFSIPLPSNKLGDVENVK